MASIQSVENIELEKSMIYVDSSGVDTFTPGIYTATLLKTTFNSDFKYVKPFSS